MAVWWHADVHIALSLVGCFHDGFYFITLDIVILCLSSNSSTCDMTDSDVMFRCVEFSIPDAVSCSIYVALVENTINPKMSSAQPSSLKWSHPSVDTTCSSTILRRVRGQVERLVRRFSICGRCYY